MGSEIFSLTPCFYKAFQHFFLGLPTSVGRPCSKNFFPICRHADKPTLISKR